MAKKTEKQLVSLVEDRFNISKSARQPWVDMWLRCYKLYRGYREELPEDEADRANLHIPKVFSHIETILPRTVAATLSRRPWVTVEPREPNDEAPARMNEQLFEYQADRQDLFSKLVGFYKEALIYGTAIGKNVWRHETTTRKMRERRDFELAGVNLSRVFGLAPIYEEVEREITLWDDPWFEHIDLFDFYGDPDGKTLSDMKWAIHRTFTSLEDMKQEGVYKNLADVEASGEYGDNRGSDDRYSEIGRAFSFAAADRSRPIELLECWEDDRLIVIANRSVVVRDEENPYWHGAKPFVAMVDTPLPHEFYGLGSIEPIRYLQEETNARRNQRLDNVTIALNKMFIAARDAGINPDDLIWRPGGVVWVDVLDDINKLIRTIDVPEVSRSSYEEEAMIDKDMQDATGASDFARGHMPSRGATATEIEALSMATSARVDLKVRLMAHQGLRGIARHWVALNQQFMTEPRFVRITGQNAWVEVNPEDIAGEFDLIPAAANVESFANKEAKRANLLEALQISANPVDAQIVDRRAIWKELLALNDFVDPEKFLIGDDPQEVPMLPGQAPPGGLPVDPLAALQAGGAPGPVIPTPAPEEVQTVE